MEHCKRCEGKGYIEGYSAIKDGVCFLCKGKRTLKEGEKPLSVKIETAKQKTYKAMKALITSTQQLKDYQELKKESENLPKKQAQVIQNMIKKIEDEHEKNLKIIQDNKGFLTDYQYNEIRKEAIQDHQVEQRIF